MKIVTRFILTIIFIPVFLIFLFSINLRFQFLVSSFWQKNFESHDTYSKLASSISKSLESQTIAEGGRASDVKILTDIASSENLRDLIEKNIDMILQYANGKAKEFTVYIPVSKIPKALLSKNFKGVTEYMSASELIKEFNISVISPRELQMISQVGKAVWALFIVAFLLSMLLVYLLYLLVDSGKRLIALGLPIFLTGLIVFILSASGTIIRINLEKDLMRSTNLGDLLIGIVAPPIIQGIISAWSIFAVVTIIIGSVLFFVKKPVSIEFKKKK